MEMIDKSAIIAEIEDIESTAISGFNSTHSRYDEAGLDICHRLKHFINTLEVKEIQEESYTIRNMGKSTTTTKIIHKGEIV